MQSKYQEVLSRLSTIFELCKQQDPEKRTLGERELENLGQDNAYPIFLLSFLMNQNTNDSEYYLRAGIEFKKWVNQNWTKPNLQDIEFSEVHIEIKKEILRLAMALPERISVQLRESILVIAKYEFPARWQNFTSNLVNYLNPQQVESEFNYRVFKLLGKLTHKYEYSVRSDPLWEEIILVAETTLNHLLVFTKLTIQTIQTCEQVEIATGLLKLLKSELKCFYHLSCQDMPPQIEENLQTWVQILAHVLKLSQSNKQIEIQVFKCKGEALKSVLLYATKYREDFESLIESFSKEIWNVCTTTTDDPKYEKFVLNAMKYFKNLLYWTDYREFFSTNIGTLLKTLVIGNLKPTKQDLDIFEDEPQVFIENVFNNAGGSSKKNYCIDLAKTIAKLYTKECVPILQSNIADYVVAFKEGKFNQENEIILINLLVDMGVTAYRPQDGVTNAVLPGEFFTFFFANVTEPYLTQVFNAVLNDKDFDIDKKLNLFHLAYHLRFVFFFRTLLDKGKMLEIAKNLSYLLRTQNTTIRYIIYYSIEMLITLKSIGEGSIGIYPHAFNKQIIAPVIPHILENVYNCVKNDPKKIDGYSVRTVLAIITMMEETAATYVEAFIALFKILITGILSGYEFSTIHTTFEALSHLFIAAKADPNAYNALETSLTPLLNLIIEKNHTDMIGYVFQIYALLLQNNSTIQQNHKVIFSSLLNLKNWGKEMTALFPAYTLFLEEYINRSEDALVQNANELLGILSALLETMMDSLFFNLAINIITIKDLSFLRSTGWLNSILTLIAKQLMAFGSENANKENMKSPIRSNFAKGMMLFVAKSNLKFTFAEFAKDIDSAFGSQNSYLFFNFFGYEINMIKAYQRQPERKIILSGIIDMILSPVFNVIPEELWKLLLNAVVENFFRRANNKINLFAYKDKDDEGSIGLSGLIVAGSKSNFQKLSYFNKKVTSYCLNLHDSTIPAKKQKESTLNLIEEEKMFVIRFNQLFQDFNTKKMVIAYLDPKFNDLLSKLFG